MTTRKATLVCLPPLPYSTIFVAQITLKANTLPPNVYQASHRAELASLKEEVSRKLPQIAESAAEKAGRQWRQRAEAEIAAVISERDRKLRDLQVGLLLWHIAGWLYSCNGYWFREPYAIRQHVFPLFIYGVEYRR